MKKNMIMKTLCGLVLVAGIIMTVGANMACAGEEAVSDWDAFMKTIDPSQPVNVDRGPLCQRVSAPSLVSEAKASISDWDMFILSIDPSQSANINNVMLCTGIVSKEVAQTSGSDWDRFMKFISPRS